MFVLAIWLGFRPIDLILIAAVAIILAILHRGSKRGNLMPDLFEDATMVSQYDMEGFYMTILLLALLAFLSWLGGPDSETESRITESLTRLQALSDAKYGDHHADYWR